MKVALVGQPRWTEMLAELLNTHCGDAVKADSMTGGRALALLGPTRHPDVLLRVGYRPGAPTSRGITFDTWWSLVKRANPSTPTVYYWIGTDLFNALADSALGRLRDPFYRAANESSHIAAAPWFLDDLKRIGIDATHIHFPVPLPSIANPISLPSQFSVLTYIPAGRSGHYGGDGVIRAAHEMPGVPFNVIGRDGQALAGAPPNVQSLRRTPNLDARYGDATVVLRLVRHDGVGATVKEALVHARHVIYSYSVPFVVQVDYDDTASLLDRLQGLRALHDAGKLDLNLGGRNYALAEFDQISLVRRLATELTRVASR